jgi:hypothetical protein
MPAGIRRYEKIWTFNLLLNFKNIKMKKNILALVAIIALIISFGFSACKKSNDITSQSIRYSKVPSNASGQLSLSNSGLSLVTSVTKPVLYSTCNRQVKVFTPSTATYELGMEFGFTYRPFGIPSIGNLDFQNIDHVAFEFSGLYADANNTVKLYRIKRMDGKYLTFQIAAAYVERFEGNLAQYQLWLVNDLGANKYNLILPKMNTCYLLRTYYDDVYMSYRAGFILSTEVTYPGSTNIFLIPDLVKTPVAH